MFKKILIANRGEIALRILRACRELGIKTVAVYSEADRNLKHVLMSDEAVCIGPARVDASYLNSTAIISALEVTNSDAVHPGYGFLSENADFAEMVEKSGFAFIGPKSETVRLMGDKITAIETMKSMGIPCVPGSSKPLGKDEKEDAQMAEKIGYPVLIKASGGGGGRGMRVVYHPKDLKQTISLTKNEAKLFFANDSVFLEKYLENPRHIEVQVLADHHGNAIYLGDRDCSIQRKNQKVIEQAPSFQITEKQREKIGKLCVDACKKMGYRGAGTFEFLHENGEFFFIEMNTRIQVEHPITEMITGIDLIKEQIRVASGDKLSFKQEDISLTGYAIECRITAEDPFTFIPSPGQIETCHFPGGFGVRIDSHLYRKYIVPIHYDPMVAKIIVHASNRDAAISKMKCALEETMIVGIDTNIPLHIEILNDSEFEKAPVDIHFLEKKLAKRKTQDE